MSSSLPTHARSSSDASSCQTCVFQRNVVFARTRYTLDQRFVEDYECVDEPFARISIELRLVFSEIVDDLVGSQLDQRDDVVNEAHDKDRLAVADRSGNERRKRVLER